MPEPNNDLVLDTLTAAPSSNDTDLDMSSLTTLSNEKEIVHHEELNRPVEVPKGLTGEETDYVIRTDVGGLARAGFFGFADATPEAVSDLAKGSVSALLSYGFQAPASLIEEAVKVPRESRLPQSGVDIGAKLVRMRTPINSNPTDPISATLLSAAQKLRQKQTEITSSLDLQPSDKEGSQAMFDLGALGTSVAASIGLSLLTRNPMAVATVFGIIAKTQSSDEIIKAYIDMGMPEEEARARAADISDVNGVANGFLEAMGERIFLRAVDKTNLIDRVIARVFAESVIEEGGQQVAEESIMAAAGVREDDAKDVLGRVARSIIYGAIASGPISIATGMVEQPTVTSAVIQIKALGYSDEAARKMVGKLYESGTVEELVSQAAKVIEQEANPLISSPENMSEGYKAILSQKASTTPQEITSLSPIFAEETDELLVGTEAEKGPSLYEKVMATKRTGQSLMAEQIAKLTNDEARYQSATEQLKQMLPLIEITDAIRNMPKDVSEQVRAERTAMAITSINDILGSVKIKDEVGLKNFITKIEMQKGILANIIESTKPAMLTMEEKTLLRAKIAAAQRGINAGEVNAREEIKAVQQEIVNILRDSNLSNQSKQQFMTQLKNTQTVEQFNKLLPTLETKIAMLEDAEAKTALIENITRLVKRSLPSVQAGKPIAKYSPRIQQILDKARSVISMSRADAEKIIQSNLELLDKGEVLSPDQILENKILDDFAGLKEKSLEELQGTFSRLRALASAGKEQFYLNKELDRQAKTQMVEQAVRAIAGSKTITDKRSVNLGERIAQIFRSAGSWIDSFSGLMNMISQFSDSPSEQGFLNQRFNTLESETNEENFVRTASQLYYSLAQQYYNVKSEGQFYKLMQERSKEENLGTFIDSSGTKRDLYMSRAEAITLYAQYQDPTLRETFFDAASGNAFTQEMLNRIFNDFLTVSDKQFAVALIKEFFPVLRPRIAQVYEQQTGVQMPQNPYYFPVNREMPAQDVGSVYLNETGFRRSLTPGNVKLRTPGTKYALARKSVDAVVMRYISEMAHFVGWRQLLGDMKYTFSDAQVQRAISQIYGEKTKQLILRNIQHFVQNAGERGAASEQWINALRKNASLSILGLRPISGMMQISSLMAYAEKTNPIAFTKNILDLLAEPTRIQERIAPLLRTETMQNRAENLNIEIKQILSTPEYKRFTANPSFANALLFFTIAGDRLTVTLGGYGLYKSLIDQGNSQATAIAQFEEATQKTQQSARLSEQADFQRGGPLIKSFGMFQSANNAMIRREIIAIRDGIRGRLPVKDMVSRIFLYHVLIPAISTLISDLGWNTGHQVRSAILGPWGSLFLFSNIVEALSRFAFGEPFYDKGITTAAFDLLDGAINAGKKTIAAFEDPSLESFLEATKFMAEEVVGPGTGLPIANLDKFVSGLLDVVSENRDNTKVQGVAKMLGASKTTVKNLEE